MDMSFVVFWGHKQNKVSKDHEIPTYFPRLSPDCVAEGESVFMDIKIQETMQEQSTVLSRGLIVLPLAVKSLS